MRGKEKFIDRNRVLVEEFDKYVLEHPEFAEKIPDKALVVLQVKGTRNLINGRGKRREK